MVQSVDRALKILDLLKDREEGLGITEISHQMGIAKSTAHRLITTLEHHHYVKKTSENGVYSLGLKFIEMTQHVLETMDIVTIARPLLQKLTKETREISHLCMLDGDELVYIDKVESQSTIRIYSQTGRRAPMYCTGVGKVLLSYFPEHKLAKYLQSTELTAFTENTLTTPEEIKQELAATRAQGYAKDEEEHELGIRCVAAPVFNHLGEVPYAISVTGPTTRMTDERMKEIIPQVMHTANEVSRNIGY